MSFGLFQPARFASRPSTVAGETDVTACETCRSFFRNGMVVMSTFNTRIPHLLKECPDWPRRRKVVLTNEPMCRSCAALGYRTLAATVDHIVPRARGGSHDLSNLQPLCHACHDSKTGREKHGGFDRVRATALDGSIYKGQKVELPKRECGSSPRSSFIKGRSYDNK